MVETIIAHFKSDPAASITVLTALVAILSQLLAMIEYFQLKAKWDFYYLDEIGRRGMRAGFHPEYLATSLAIILCFILFLSIDILTTVVERYLVVTLLSISVTIFALAYAIFYFFSYFSMVKKIWNKKQYKKITFVKAFLTTLKYSTVIMILLVLYKRIITDSTYIIQISILAICLCGIIYIYFEYNISKYKTSRYMRCYILLDYKGSKYAILEISQDKKSYYAVQCLNEDENLYLYLDTKIVIPVENTVTQKAYFKKIIRVVNGVEIDNYSKFYQIG